MIPVLILVAAIFLSACDTKRADDSQATAESIGEVVSANNRFAFELYSEYSIEKSNLFFSPYSISSALAMTYEGARGKTADEMAAVFHFPREDITRKSGFAAVINSINKPGKDYKLSAANALWAQEDYKFLPEYIEAVDQYYTGKVTNMDFSKSEESRKIINKWVEDNTNNKIRDLLTPGIITPETRLVLTNAVYFKGDWLYQFDKKRTSVTDFKVSEEETVKIPMMSIQKEFMYAETEDLQIISIPYKGEDLSMVILLPKNNISLVEEYLDSEKYLELVGMMKKQKVSLFMPKFKLEAKYPLGETLAEMGMPSAFGDADFSGMEESRSFVISDVIHQAYVDVNEEGTEAAAATAVAIKTTSAMMTTTFMADHPFIFTIQDNVTGAILFLGKVEDPTK